MSESAALWNRLRFFGFFRWFASIRSLAPPIDEFCVISQLLPLVDLEPLAVGFELLALHLVQRRKGVVEPGTLKGATSCHDSAPQYARLSP